MDAIVYRKSSIEMLHSPNDFRYFSWFTPFSASFYLAVGTRLLENLLMYCNNQTAGFVQGTCESLSLILIDADSAAEDYGLQSELRQFKEFIFEFNNLLQSSNRPKLSEILSNSDTCRTLLIGMKLIFLVVCPIPDIQNKIMNDEPLDFEGYLSLLKFFCSSLQIHIWLYNLPNGVFVINNSEMRIGPILHLMTIPDEFPVGPPVCMEDSRKFIRFGMIYSKLCLDILMNGHEPGLEILNHPYYMNEQIKKKKCADCGNITEIFIDCPNHTICCQCRSRAIALGINTCGFKGCNRKYNAKQYEQISKVAKETYGENLLPIGKYACVVCDKSLPLYTRHCDFNICEKCCKQYGYPCKYSEMTPLIEITEFECNICLETLNEPYTTPCGHHFCQRCAVDWFSKFPRCPNDNNKIAINDLIYASDIAELIEEERNKISAENALIQMMCWKALNKKGSYYYLAPYLDRYLEDATLCDRNVKRLKEVCDWACKLVNKQCNHDAEKLKCSCSFEHCLVCLKIMARYANKRNLPLLCFCGVDLSRRNMKKLRKYLES